MAFPPQSTNAAAVVSAIATKLRTDLTLSTDQVKQIDVVTLRGKFTETFVQKGIALALDTARPTDKLEGGGRYDYRIRRTLFVVPCTEALLDPSGRNEQGLARHWKFEDDIFNSLLLRIIPPLVLPLTPVSVDSTKYELPVDSGRYRSIMAFDLVYPVAVDNPCGT